ALEVDITSSSLDRQGIYAALGVPEVWQFDGVTLRFFLLQADGTYTAVGPSPTFPDFPPAEIVRFIEGHTDIDDVQWRRRCRAWVRAQIDRGGLPDADAANPA